MPLSSQTLSVFSAPLRTPVAEDGGNPRIPHSLRNALAPLREIQKLPESDLVEEKVGDAHPTTTYAG